MKYKVRWDNNYNACGELKKEFDTPEEAIEEGELWVSSMYELDYLEEYTFEVVDEEGKIIEY